MNDRVIPDHFSTSEVINRPRVVTIGTFDGVHLGHQALFRAASRRALELEIDTMAITFEPVPTAVLRPDLFPGRVTSSEEKMRLLDQQPLDEIVTFTFDLALSQQSPESFMEHVRDLTGLRELWVGEAFALGKNRAGNVERLREIGRDLDFDVTAVSRLTLDGNVVSSSAVRKAIMEGDVSRAASYLGRPFRVSGEVIHGAHLGRTIGYPTANVLPPPELVPMADGIYVSLAMLPGETVARPSMTYVGTRPTVNSGERLVETHLLDFNDDLYGQVIRVDVLQRLRGDELFSGIDALVAQLKSDEASTRAYLRPSSVDRHLV